MEVAEHFGVDHADAADGLALEDDVCASLGEVEGVTRLLQLVVLLENCADLGHDEAEGPLHDLEGRVGVQVHYADPSLVPGAVVPAAVLKHDVTYFKYFLRKLKINNISTTAMNEYGINLHFRTCLTGKS